MLEERFYDCTSRETIPSSPHSCSLVYIETAKACNANIYIYIYLQSRCTGTALIFSARSLRGYRSWIRFECIRERVQSGWEYVGEKRMDARAWRVERISFLSLGRVRAKSGETRLVMEGWRKKPMREGFVRSSPCITAPDSTRRLSFPWVMSGESWSEKKNSRGGREVV